jgi:hypothetical protein
MHWVFALFAEQSVEAQYRVRRVSFAHLIHAKQSRLDAEIKFRGAGQKLSDSPPAPALSYAAEEALFGPGAKEVAKSAFAAGQADLRDLAVARRDTARIGYRELMEEYRAGAPFDLLETARQLLDAELAILDDPAERLAAVERYWGQMWMAEEIVQAQFKVGRVGLADWMQSRRQRLDAEIRMREAEDKMKKK